MIKTFHPSLSFKVNKNLFEFVECRYCEHFGPASESVRYSGLLSKGSNKSSSVRAVT